jgi:hypothetical protein
MLESYRTMYTSGDMRLRSSGHFSSWFWYHWRYHHARARTYDCLCCSRSWGSYGSSMWSYDWRRYSCRWRVCGPVQRGLINSQSQSWSYIFYLLGGIAAIPVVIGLLVIPKDVPQRIDEDRRVDWAGGLIVTTALCLFCFSVTESGIAPNGWATPRKTALSYKW